MSLSRDDTPEPVKQVALRLPESLHRRVHDLARRDRRSLHAELLVWIEQAVEREESRTP